MVKPIETVLTAEVTARFNQIVDGHVIDKQIGKIAGLSPDITLSSGEHSGAPLQGGKAPSKGTGFDFNP